MRRTALIMVAALGLLPGIVLAGASNASLKCTGKSSGKTALVGSIPGDFAEFELQLKNKNGVVDMTDANGTINVITDLDTGVFMVAVTLKDARNLLLYAIPKSVKSKGGSRREFKARFDAVLLEAPKPGYRGPITYDSIIRDVRLTCTLEHAT